MGLWGRRVCTSSEFAQATASAQCKSNCHTIIPTAIDRPRENPYLGVEGVLNEMNSISIPFSIEDQEQECIIELRDLSQREILAEIHRGTYGPGVHTVEFDPESMNLGIDAGVYLLTLTVGGERRVYPFQYMP